MEVGCKNRSVMPCDTLGRTRITMTETTSDSLQGIEKISCLEVHVPKGMGNLLNLCRVRDRGLELSPFNEECLVVAIHQIATNALLLTRGEESPGSTGQGAR
jgi:hypothetical protein